MLRDNFWNILFFASVSCGILIHLYAPKSSDIFSLVIFLLRGRTWSAFEFSISWSQLLGFYMTVDCMFFLVSSGSCRFILHNAPIVSLPYYIPLRGCFLLVLSSFSFLFIQHRRDAVVGHRVYVWHWEAGRPLVPWAEQGLDYLWLLWSCHVSWRHKLAYIYMGLYNPPPFHHFT